jgi:hypothetical protein
MEKTYSIQKNFTPSLHLQILLRSYCEPHYDLKLYIEFQYDKFYYIVIVALKTIVTYAISWLLVSNICTINLSQKYPTEFFLRRNEGLFCNQGLGSMVNNLTVFLKSFLVYQLSALELITFTDNFLLI